MEGWIVEERGDVEIWTVDGEARRNAISMAMLRGLEALLARAAERRTLRCVVLTGAGDKAFCAGADLKERATMSAEDVHAFHRGLRAGLRGIETAPQVFVEGFGDWGILYRLRVWTRAIAQLSVFIDAVNSRIWYELKRQGLEIPQPVSTVRWHHAEREDERLDAAHRRASIDLLRGVNLFAELDDAALEHLANLARHSYFDDGEVLVRQGELGDSLFVIERGRVSVSAASSEIDTAEIQLASMEAGAFFGEISLLTGEPRSATVKADGGCEVLELSKEHLAPLLQRDPRLAELMAAAVVARQARSAAQIEDRRKRLEEPAAMRAHASLLGRIRSFFKLPG